jgi:DNA-binding transcriptional ArsR family regulator
MTVKSEARRAKILRLLKKHGPCLIRFLAYHIQREVEIGTADRVARGDVRALERVGLVKTRKITDIVHSDGPIVAKKRAQKILLVSPV